jgi:hypothetical protein
MRATMSSMRGRGNRFRPGAPPVNLNYSPDFKVKPWAAAKKAPVVDSLVPPIIDFGYAGARQSIRVRAYSALDQETMP